ncbi:hypothetical protein CEXT_407571 [Caerostris extrusa]|uniref:Uncharacterized protein n=1 Tax=Caerostris extrusa TaxID=172846 RepID=A0AAV4QVK7_CAEEX|nr:hypothetical protein CEXT_407571 [Caerostris extrusa]
MGKWSSFRLAVASALLLRVSQRGPRLWGPIPGRFHKWKIFVKDEEKWLEAATCDTNPLNSCQINLCKISRV